MTITLDPAHEAMDIFEQEITQDVWKEKYRYKDEHHPFDSFARVVKGIYKDDDPSREADALAFMRAGLWVPAGRIQAGAGTKKHVTLMNCYVCRTIHDSMEGIADALKDAMLTLQQGGGIGMDFSTLRPRGAALRRLGEGAYASGPVSFMDMWDSMCATIMSAGSRRGAMMATLRCDHPDLIEFIEAKHKPGRLTNFNVSVLVTDLFMKAVEDDATWHLHFDVPPADGSSTRSLNSPLTEQYVYKSYPARQLWDMIMDSTYKYSEPGVIFIDRINQTNNLKYCEDISCTNPCGEQPLPPNGTCNLGAVNLARMVLNPFQNGAAFQYDLLADTVRVGVRFLDNVIDQTNYPLEAQRTEETNKRRLGLGITGLADALAQLKIRYGSEHAVNMTECIMATLATAAYEESIYLAEHRKPFKLYNRGDFLDSMSRTVFNSLDEDIQQRLNSHGIRNGTLLTIAPTGTTSIYYGNVSSGLEPVFDHKVDRQVLQADGSTKRYVAYGYSYKLYCQIEGARHIGELSSIEIPGYMVTAGQITVRQHIDMQAAAQKWVDTSISKTINCPEDISKEDLAIAYMDAYSKGCMGCTTYRPSDVRGAVMTPATEKSTSETPPSPEGKEILIPTRPSMMEGCTYKLKWPSLPSAIYVTINNWDDGQPYEIFISTMSVKYTEWMTALTRMISSIMRQGIDISFIPEELQQVASSHDSAWIDGIYYPSLIAYIGKTIGDHIGSTRNLSDWPGATIIREDLNIVCPRCNSPTLIAQEGCWTCTNCDYSNCA